MTLPEPAIYREDVVTIMFLLADILTELQAIRALLGEDDGTEEEADA